MKILFLSAYLPGRGLHGGSSRIFEIFHHLHRFHELTLVSFKNRNDDDSRINELKQMCAKLHIVSMPDKRPFYWFPFEPFIDYVSDDFRSRLGKVLKKEKFDLVQFEYVQTGIYRRHIPAGIPCLLTEHEVNFLAHRKNIPFLHSPFQKLKTYYDSLQLMKRELEIMQTMDKVICMNQPEAEALREYLPEERLAVLPHGVDTTYFQPVADPPPEPFSLGFFGAYHHYPNIDAVFYFVDKIFPQIKERVPEARFYIIGIHPPPEIVALGERPDITVTGFVPDIRPWLARCQVIVAPIRQGLGMRVKMLEAMAMAKPLVATDLACAGLDIVDGQHGMIANTDESFAESVCYLLQDRTCAEGFGRASRQLVEENFNYTSVGKRLEELYLSMIHKK